MKYNDCKCKKTTEGLAPLAESIVAHSNTSCNMPIKRHLEPVLIAKIYNQPIIEELPYSAMSLTLDNTTSISSACSEIKPMCYNYDCNDGYNYTL